MFRYSNVTVTPTRVSVSGAIVVSVDVTNTGTGSGDHVVHLYMRHLNPHGERPREEVKAFQRVSIEPGDKQRTTTAFSPGLQQP